MLDYKELKQGKKYKMLNSKRWIDVTLVFKGKNRGMVEFKDGREVAITFQHAIFKERGVEEE